VAKSIVYTKSSASQKNLSEFREILINLKQKYCYFP